MSLLRVACLAPLLVVSLGAPASSAFTSGVWQGEPSYTDAGALSDCTMTAQSESGILLAFIISRNFDWGVVFADDRWNLKVGRTMEVALSVDANTPIPSIGKVVDAHGILVPLQNSDPVVDAMRHGQMLTATIEVGTFSFQLTDTDDAISALAACVTENLKAEKDSGSRPSFAALEKEAAAASKDKRSKLFSEGEAAVFASNLLSSAGITNYQLIDPAKNPMPSFDVVWTYQSGIIGAIAGYKDMSAVNLDEAESVVVADDDKNCDGDFASGKKLSDPVEQLRVRRLFTSCRTDGKKIEIHYTLVKTESGHLIQIAHLNLDDTSGDIANADSAFLHGAALQNFK